MALRFSGFGKCRPSDESTHQHRFHSAEEGLPLQGLVRPAKCRSAGQASHLQAAVVTSLSLQPAIVAMILYSMRRSKLPIAAQSPAIDAIKEPYAHSMA